MAGSALGKLWGTHPRIAFALHLGACVFFAILLAWGIVKLFEWYIDLMLAVGLALMALTLVVFTREAIARGWSRGGW